MPAKFHQKHAYATHKQNLSPRDLNVAEVVEQFHKEENSPTHRNGTFKIDKPFEDAIETILKVRPGTNPHKRQRKNGA
jgi:hypothetical protein